MQTQKQILFLLLALATVNLPALAQGSATSTNSPSLGNPRFAFPPPSQNATAVKPPLDRSHDAVTMGLAKAKVYRFASADYPGAFYSYVYDENKTTVLGQTALTTVGAGVTGFTLTSGDYQLLILPGSMGNNSPIGINTAGNIVGTYTDDTGAPHGFLYAGGVVSNVDDPSANVGKTFPQGINDEGEIVGYYFDDLGDHGFSTNDGVTFTAIDYPNAEATFAFGLNSTGEIVGSWEDLSGIFHGFWLSNGVFTSFDFPLATATYPGGINDSGEIAGYFTDASGMYHGFTLSGNAYSQIDVPSATGTQITRIKNNGHITGSYVDSLGAGESHGLTGH